MRLDFKKESDMNPMCDYEWQERLHCFTFFVPASFLILRICPVFPSNGKGFAGWFPFHLVCLRSGNSSSEAFHGNGDLSKCYINCLITYYALETRLQKRDCAARCKHHVNQETLEAKYDMTVCTILYSIQLQNLHSREAVSLILATSEKV